MVSVTSNRGETDSHSEQYRRPGLQRTARIHLVRHGRAAAGWDVDPDPGLDDVGRSQAQETAEALALLDPRSIVSSPLRRCRETAEFLSRLWSNAAVETEPRVAEIPSPVGVPMAERVEWLRDAMSRNWGDLSSDHQEFRRHVVEFVSGLTADTVVFSHFIAINAVIGACVGDDRVVIDSLDNASVTVVDVHSETGLHLVQRGRRANTLIR